MAYAPCLRALLSLPQCVGMIGGRPRKSYYFIGFQGERLLYLDPHYVQPSLAAEHPAVASCHFTSGVRSVRLASIDPSLALGFVCGTASQFDAFCGSCASVASGTLPVFSIADRPPDLGRLSFSGAEPDGADADVNDAAERSRDDRSRDDVDDDTVVL